MIPCARPVIVVRNDIRKKKIFQLIWKKEDFKTDTS